jgi:hypothetical protein
MVYKSLNESKQCSVNYEREDELTETDVTMLCPRWPLLVDGTPNSPEKPLADRACQQTAADADGKKDDFTH